MAIVISNKLGEGLQEQAGAGRELNIFGNDFNPVYPTATFGIGANFPLGIVNESATYDFSTITPGHEVVTCLTYITGIPDSQSFRMEHKWYDKDNTLILTYYIDVSTPASGGPWSLWMFSYVGYADWELNADGACKCIITITGDISDVETKNFTISNVIDADTLKHDSGYTWVEGQYLHYTDYWGWEHIIPRILVSSGSWDPGYMWIEDTVTPLKHAIFYIDNNGDKRRTREGVVDTYRPVTGATPGYMWIEDGYHGNYISFISMDGKKYIVADGVKADF